MKIAAQLFSKKGFLGPEIEFRVTTVAKISEELVRRIDDLPDQFEDVQVTDWTEIKITVTR